MLNFTEANKNAQVLAIYYSKVVGDKFVIDFMSSKTEISSPEEAVLVTKVFWEMVDKSIDDNNNENAIEGIDDIEFWMHKLFNKVSGYLTLNGYKEQWVKTTQEIKSS